ncbi:hypothetical protein LTR56_017579 [Elasticomyces elasticus]|nr:hypothetical protein LTR56_017579 [Elasticomyces elasticus]KAK3630763.1 hypothetical protein LTR22_021342 [Elasticomyces elasticus]KAK4909177.1 hypothetical protein LTR49_022000 [Elasticomyces elasticus]
MPSISKVTLLGADGKVGATILQGLLSAKFEVTILKRQSSKSSDENSEHVKVVRIPDEFKVDDLQSVLQGQDAVVASIKGSQVEIQKRIAQACIKAGVQRFIPADFGSCDSSSSLTQELVPLYKRKTELREYLQELVKDHPSFSWTSLVCGHFFDWSLDFIHVFPAEQRADILDDGEKVFSLSTLSRTAEATVRILQRADQTKNRMLYVQSFSVSQNEVVREYEAATGAKWKVTKYDAEQFKNEQKAKADAGDSSAIEELVWYLGTMDADWRTRDDFAMQLLGLEDEDLGEAVRKVLQSA